MKGTVAEIFEKYPKSWTLKGDSHLWENLKEFFSNMPLPYSVERFVENFCIFYKLASGYEIKQKDKLYTSVYDREMKFRNSVNSKFWLEKGLPLLIQRLENLNEIYGEDI